MRALLLGQFRHRPVRGATVGLAVLVAAVAFVLLAASTASSELKVRRTLAGNFRGAYDILVRPQGSFTTLEEKQGLIRDNYLSGIYGGITLRQYHLIEHLPGVEVAAPIANVGTVLAQEPIVLSLRRYLGQGQDELLRVRLSWVAQDGLSRYPASETYLYATRRQFDLGPQTPVVRDPLTGRPDLICDGYDETKPVVLAPFVPVNSSSLFCSSPRLSGALRRFIRSSHEPPGTAYPPQIVFVFEFPLNVAAIDPAAEAKLVGLSKAVVGGSYLKASSGPRRVKGSPSWLAIPAIAASRSFVDDQLQAEIERLSVPTGTDVPGMLGADAGECGNAVPAAAGGCPENAGGESAPREPGPPGAPRANAYSFLRALRGIPVGRRSIDAERLYARAIGNSRPGLFTLGDVNVGAYWRGAPVRFKSLGAKTLEPLTVRNPPGTYAGLFTTSFSGFVDQPTDNRDVQFRKLSDTAAREGALGPSLTAEAREPLLRVIGRFDPRRLRGFSPLSKVPLETYYPPTLEPADARTRRLLHGKPLLPSQNLGDYEQQPPLLLTNLRGLVPLLSNERFSKLSPKQQRAPVSVIRVRVKGVTGPNGLSETRIRTVAQLIHDRTGLDVDITAGSSPTPMTVDLSAGMFGRPPLVLREGWVKKGASVSYLRALDRKDLALFALILVVCSLFLGNGAFASVRTRRSEFGALLTLGWSRAQLFQLVLYELCLLGLLAGVVGTGLSVALVSSLGLHFPLRRVLLVLPLALLLAVVGGLFPAWQASKGTPLDAIRPVVTAARRMPQVRGLLGMALVNLSRIPGRSVAGGLGLTLAVCALTIVYAIETAFRGTLVGTLLGNAVSLQVRGADFVALALTLALSALSAADVLYLNLRERRAELVTLSSTGWSDREQQALVILEAALLAFVASMVGAVAGVLIGGLLLHVSLAPLVLSAALAGGAATAIAVVAGLLPLLRLRRLAAPEVLAGE